MSASGWGLNRSAVPSPVGGATDVYDTFDLLVRFEVEDEDAVKEELRKRGRNWHKSGGSLRVSSYSLDK